MSKVLLIGDVHGNINAYWKLLQQNKYDYSYQLGDFGFLSQHNWHLKNIDNKFNKIVFGNHDWWPYLYEKHSCGYFSHDPIFNILTIAGAESSDKSYRILEKEYFKEEELNYQMRKELIEYYTLVKPNIILSHECPQLIRQKYFNIYESSLTSRLLDNLLNIHKPNMWIFAHHHKSLNIIESGVNFIGLNTLETTTLTL